MTFSPTSPEPVDPASTPVFVPISRRPRHPGHGVHDPRPTTSDRRPGSIRRTTTIDSVRPGDMMHDLVQTARGRDLITSPDGTTHVVDQVEVHAVIDYRRHFLLSSIAASPPRPELDRLVGCSVSTGFRASMWEVVPDDREHATLLHLLLDDLPGAALVSGYAIGAAGVRFERMEGAPVLQIENLCSGFRTGGTIMTEKDEHGHPPIVTGPPAPVLAPSDDPIAWHSFDPLPERGMRRARCLDVWNDDGLVRAHAYFRDSHVDELLNESVIHEYSVEVDVDPETRTFVASRTTAHSLPWVECIHAVDSGARIVGMSIDGLRPTVRQDFVGITTCTHLNDTLRSLEDIRSLMTRV